MNQLPYDNLDQLAEVLQTVFTGNNTTIQQANDVLMQMAVDPQRFIDAMMNIITSEKSDQNVQKIKKAAAMVTLRILSPFIENKKSPPEQKQYILEAIIKALYSPHVITTIKASLQQFLSVIYYADSTGVFKEQSLNLAKEKLAQGQLNDYAASLYIILPIIENPSNSLGALSNWFEYLLEDLLNAGDNIIEGVGVEILDILKGENHEQKVVNVFMGLEILKVWTQIIFEFIKRLGKEEVETITKASYIEHVVDKEKIGRTLLKTLILQIPTEHQIKGCMFSTSGVKQLDQLLNTVKMITVQCFEKILYFMVEAAKVQSKSKILNANHNKLYTLIQTDGFKAILQSLMHLCKNNYTVLEKNLMDKQFQECVSECLGILAKLTAFQELYTPFSDYKNMIIMDICLPLIASTKKDIIMFSEDPQSFVNITSNIEEDQETQNVKLQAIQFLRRICENIDGAMSSLIMLVGMLIDFTLKSNDLSIIEEKYPKLADYKESLFVAAIEPRIRVETSLLVLASVNEFTQTRPDLMQIIDSLFTEYHEYFLGAELDPLIKSRMCLFLGSFVSSLFKKEENKELYAQHLRFLVECAGITSEQQQAVTEQANQTLYDMLAEKQHVLRMAPLIPDILEKLISYTKTTQCITFFDVLHEIVRLYSHFISQNPELLLKVISDLVERGKAEYEFLLNDKGLSKLTLTKIWNIIKIIGEKESYLKYQDEIEKVLVPLFNFIIENESQPYDDDLLGYISSTIKVAKRVSPVDWEIFRFIPTIFERYQNLITPIFATLNNIIVYGREVIEENAEIKHQLIDIGIKAINTTHPDAGPAAISLGAVLFQILIQYVGIPNEEWERMLVACIEKLHGSDKSFLKARIGGVFLLAFMRNFEFTQACLLQHNALGVVLELFTNINHAVVFDSHVYDRKVFLIALSTLLTQENANVMIKEKYPQILDILISFLGYVQHVERERAVSGNKRKIAPGNDSDSDEEEKDGVATNRYILKSLLDNNSTLNPSELKNRYDFDDDDDDDDDDEDDDEDEDDDAEDGDGEAYFPTEKDEANHYVTHLVSDIKTQDEFTEFKNAIQKLKQIDQQLLGRLAVSLPERKKILMKEVLQSQRVVVSSEGKQQVGATRKMVKTVGRKVATVNNQP